MNQQNQIHAVVGIDPGEVKSGITLTLNGYLSYGMNKPNSELTEYLVCMREQYGANLLVIVEDMRPYDMRITNTIIRTIKFIGQIELRLADLNIKYYLIARWEIKRWIYTEYPNIALPRILKKIEYKKSEFEKLNRKHKKLSPSFAYVDDWVVVRAMKQRWNIPNATVHNKNKYGLTDHSWQALALITFYMTQEILSDQPTRATF